jgi:flagellar biosynthetic protein FliR
MDGALSPDTLLPDWTAFVVPAALAWSGPVWLTTMRFLGLCWTAPLLKHGSLPWTFRLLLAVILGVTTGVAIGEPMTHPPGVGTLLFLSVGELVLGGALGFAVQLLFTACELAAGLIDAQAGLALGQTLSPRDGETTTPSASLLTILATLTFLSLAPVSGDLVLVRGVLDSFRTLPAGGLAGGPPPLEFLHDAMTATLQLGLQVAAPLVATMGLLQVLWACLTRSRGGGLWQQPLVPLRVLASLLILAATLTEIGPRLGHEFERSLEATGHAAAMGDAAGAGETP